MRTQIILFILFVWTATAVHAQLPTYKEIVKSGKYYYCKDYGQDPEQLKEQTKQCLLGKIKKDPSTPASPAEYKAYIHFMPKKLTGEWRMVAYVAKNLETARRQFETKPAQEVITEGPKTTDEKNSTNKTSVADNHSEIAAVREIKTTRKEADIGLKSEPVMATEPETKGMKPSNKPEKHAHSETFPSGTHPILQDFARTQNAKEAWKLLRQLKNEGKVSGNVVSERYMSRHNPDNFNIIMVDRETGKVVGVFAKGKNENLKRNRQIRKADPEYLQIWFVINE